MQSKRGRVDATSSVAGDWGLECNHTSNKVGCKCCEGDVSAKNNRELVKRESLHHNTVKVADEAKRTHANIRHKRCG